MPRARTRWIRRACHGQAEAEKTRALLQRGPGRLHAQIDELLLAALGRGASAVGACARCSSTWRGTGARNVGRAANLSRTVGWFTALYPLLLEANEGFAPPRR